MFLAHARTFLLVTELVSFIVVNSLIICVIITSSFGPFINCHFKCLFASLYSQSAAIILSLPIQSSAVSSDHVLKFTIFVNNVCFHCALA